MLPLPAMIEIVSSIVCKFDFVSAEELAESTHTKGRHSVARRPPDVCQVTMVCYGLTARLQMRTSSIRSVKNVCEMITWLDASPAPPLSASHRCSTGQKIKLPVLFHNVKPN